VNHWKPDGDSARWLKADAYAPTPKGKPWPEGATPGLVLVAAACLAVGALLYQVAGPRQPVEQEAARETP
jgi:hypothetical protein